MINEDFSVTKEKSAEGLKFFIKGRVNSVSSEELQHHMQEALKDGETNIILNMLWVEYLSSAGIRVILKTYKEANEAGKKFGIEMPSENVKNVLGMTALDEMLIS